MDSIHLVISIEATNGWEVHEMYAKNYFLHNDISE
jgi:hypothetical protein